MKDVLWRILLLLLFIVLLAFITYPAQAQIEARHFNAGWNSANSVSWFMDLEDCKTKGLTDIASNKEEAAKHKIAVVPTIIIFKDGEEALRFQADLSFKMVATKEEVQEAINELLMSDF